MLLYQQSKKSKTSQSGMVIVLTLFVLMTIAGFGVIYYKSASGKLNESWTEAERIRARSLANAGFNKGVILIRDRYKRSFFSWRYPDQGNSVIGESEFTGMLGGGTWKINSVKSCYLETLEGDIGPYDNVPYVLHGNQKGLYDIIRINATGKMTDSKISASVTGLVKMIRYNCQY